MAKSIAAKILNASFINENGCWCWLKGVNGDGYAYMMICGVSQSAHRWSYEAFNGDIPKGLHVLHRCDVRNCVNPDHLFLGSNQDNVTDRQMKNRGVIPRIKGSECSFSKLKEVDVLNIKARITLGETHTSIAKLFNVNRSTISAIKSGRNWRHVWISA